MRSEVKTDTLILIGKVLVGCGLAVTIPVIVLSLLHVTGHSVDSVMERKLLSLSAIGFAIVSTGGGVFVGHKVVTDDKHRMFLLVAWAIQLCGVVFIGSTYLLLISEGGEETLNMVLPQFWMRVVYFIVIVATPEIGVVASLVCVADLLGVNAEIVQLTGELDAKSVEANNLQGELIRFKESMETEIKRRVRSDLRESLEGVGARLGRQKQTA